jgi:hypothetical protein
MLCVHLFYKQLIINTLKGELTSVLVNKPLFHLVVEAVCQKA